MLSAMLLNELQKQASENQQLAAQMIAMKASTGREIAQLKASRERDLRSMQDRLAALEQAVKTQSDDGIWPPRNHSTDRRFRDQQSGFAILGAAPCRAVPLSLR